MATSNPGDHAEPASIMVHASINATAHFDAQDVIFTSVFTREPRMRDALMTTAP
jgi:hypothetical protein